METSISSSTENNDLEALELYEKSRLFPYSQESSPIPKPEDVAAAVLFAVTQPPNVAINEILVQGPTDPL